MRRADRGPIYPHAAVMYLLACVYGVSKIKCQFVNIHLMAVWGGGGHGSNISQAVVSSSLLPSGTAHTSARKDELIRLLWKPWRELRFNSVEVYFEECLETSVCACAPRSPFSASENLAVMTFEPSLFSHHAITFPLLLLSWLTLSAPKAKPTHDDVP